MKKQIYETSEFPPLGEIPSKMYAWTIRTENLGMPIQCFKKEIVDIPELKKDEILVLNVVSGINYNGVWASLGIPKNVVNEHKRYEEAQDFLICGSESSGIVYAVGENVKEFKIGDEVICLGTQFDVECDVYKEIGDPRVSPTFRIWGYEGNWGSFAQYSKVKEVQCIPKNKELSWEVSATCMATGGTVYSMLTHWKGNELKKGDIVLVWGGLGGVGSAAITIVNALGGIPIAVVSSDERGEMCTELGAKGYINRNNYDHWGSLSDDFLDSNNPQYRKWFRSAMRFRKEIWKIVGERKDPQIIVEHPGADTLPTSMFLCDKKGMVVICGATTGYIGTLDLRFFWLGIKRLQGAHAGTREEACKFEELIVNQSIDLKVTKIVTFDDIPAIHQQMYENNIPSGKTASVINEKIFYEGFDYEK